jgi:pilus assembly protein CpaB
MKEKIIPVVSILIGVLAFFLTAQYLRSKQREVEAELARIYAGARKIRVVAAAHDIPGGTVLKEADLGMKEIFASGAPERVVTVSEADMLLGRTVLFEIQEGKPVVWSEIKGGEPADRGLASAVKPGLRAISISVGGPAGVSGMIQPNDRVDVLGTFTFPSKTVPGEMESVTLTVLQDVTILAVGQRLAKHSALQSARRSGGYSTVTAEVTPREAELLVFAQQVKGRLVLSLRNPSDVSFESDLPETNFEYLQNRLPELNQYRQRYIRHKKNMP